jgi:hypothetical protein
MDAVFFLPGFLSRWLRYVTKIKIKHLKYQLNTLLSVTYENIRQEGEEYNPKKVCRMAKKMMTDRALKQLLLPRTAT